MHYSWDDAREEIKQLFSSFVRRKLETDWVVISDIPEGKQPVRLYCPKCGSKAAESSGDAFHLDEERFGKINNFLFEGRVDRFVCGCCNQDFYLPEGN